jgi:hypothetical protein
MNGVDRRRLVSEHKEREGCRTCGSRRGADLQLVRPDGSGLQLSRLLAMRSISDEALWEEIARRVVVCRRCYLATRPLLPPSRGFHLEDMEGSVA